MAIARTGTSLDTRTLIEGQEVKRAIALIDFTQYFLVPPLHLYVLLSVCWGGFPSAEQIRQLADPEPYVFGPLTNIKIKDVRKAQRKIFRLLQDRKGASDIKGFIDAFNKKRWAVYRAPAMGVYLPGEGVYPEGAIGRFAAKGYEADLIVNDLLPSGAEGAVIPIFTGFQGTAIRLRGGIVLESTVGPKGTVHENLWVKFRDRDWEEWQIEIAKNGEPQECIRVVVEWPDD